MKSSTDSEKMLLYDPPHMKICNTYETIGKYSNLIKGRDAATITFTFFHTKNRQEKCKQHAANNQHTLHLQLTNSAFCA